MNLISIRSGVLIVAAFATAVAASSAVGQATSNDWLEEMSQGNTSRRAVSGTLVINIAEEPKVDRTPREGQLQPWHRLDNSWLTRKIRFGLRPDNRWHAVYQLPKFGLDFETGTREALALVLKHDERTWLWAKWAQVKGDADTAQSMTEIPFGFIEHHWIGRGDTISLIESIQNNGNKRRYSTLIESTAGGISPTPPSRPETFFRHQMLANPKMIQNAGGRFWGLTLGDCPTPDKILSELLSRSENHQANRNSVNSFTVRGSFVKHKMGQGGRVMRFTPFAGRDLLAKASRFEAIVDAKSKQLTSYRILSKDDKIIESGAFENVRPTNPDELTGYVPYPGLQRNTYPLDVALSASRSLPQEEILELYQSSESTVNYRVPSVLLLPSNPDGRVRLIEEDVWTPERNAMFRVLLGGEPSWFANTNIRTTRLVVDASRTFRQAYPDGIPPGKNWRFDVGFGMAQSYLAPVRDPHTGKRRNATKQDGARNAHFDAMLNVLRKELQNHEVDSKRYSEVATYTVDALGEMEHFIAYKKDDPRYALVTEFLTELLPFSRTLLLERPRIVLSKFESEQRTFDLHLATRIVEDKQLWKAYGKHVLAAVLRSYVVTAKGLTSHDNTTARDHFAFELVEKINRQDIPSYAQLRLARAELRNNPLRERPTVDAAKRLYDCVAKLVREQVQENVSLEQADEILGQWHRPPKGREILRITRRGNSYIGQWETRGGKKLNYGTWEFDYDGGGTYSGRFKNDSLQVSLIDKNKIKAKSDGFYKADVNGFQTLRRFEGSGK